MGVIKGYKVFNPDWTCRGFQYEVGKIFTLSAGSIDICSCGFHFCENAIDCFNYYKFDNNNRVAEIEALGDVKSSGDKSVTDKIKIVREIPWEELLTIVNSGKNNTGLGNTGNRNTGSRNTGSRNTGSCNTGNRNTGSRNTGSRNTGSCNTGSCNTGSCNTGSCNTGDWNSTDFSTGFFNSKQQPIYMFNKPINMSRHDIIHMPGMQILQHYFVDTYWISSENMTDTEKEDHPQYETTGGYLKTIDFKTACQLMWDKLADDEKALVKDLPNFDASIFESITGISDV